MKEWIKVAIAVLICEAAGFIGAIFTFSSLTTWYASLMKPFFSPPDWVFPVAWPVLYALMGFSLYYAWNENIENKKAPMMIFSIQLLLNTLWIFIFFGLENQFYSLVEIIILWFAILATIISFFRFSRKAAYMLIPYLLWVIFAAVLNYYVWIFNI